MTEGQIRYQTIMENQRHNLAVERISQQEQDRKEREFQWDKLVEGHKAEGQYTKDVMSAFESGSKFAKNVLGIINPLMSLFG